MDRHLIYAFIDENNTPFYIGKTKNLKQRNRAHLREIKNDNKLPKYNKMRKILNGDYKKIHEYIIIIESDISYSDINDREVFHIENCRRMGIDLKNLTDGGDGGFKFTTEGKERMSKYRLGKKRSKEARAKISEGRMGIEFSEEHIRNLSKSWIYENHNNAEINAKKSRTSTGKINIKIYRCIAPDGTEYITERGLSQFCREMNLTQALMSKVSLGQRVHHKGWKCTLY